MKRIIVACGTGMATSSMISEKVQEFLNEKKIDYQIRQCQLTELSAYDGDADLFITSMKLDNHFKTPVVVGTPFLIGINEETAEEQIMDILTN